MEGAKVALELAAQVPRYLTGLEFPADQSEIVEHAREQRADPALVTALRALPQGTYASAAEVAEHVGGTSEDSPADRGKC